MAALDEKDMNDLNLGLPDLSTFSETERRQVIAVMQRAKEFEAQESNQLRKPMEGLLYKYTNVMMGYQHRWFLLDHDAGMLEYFEKPAHKNQRPRGSVHLAGAVISPSDEDSQTFTVNAANGEIYRLRASDTRERQHWVDRLRSSSEYHTSTIIHTHPAVPSVPNDIPQSKRHRDSLNGPQTITLKSQHRSAQGTGKPADPFQDVKEYLTQAEEYNHRLMEQIEDLPHIGPGVTSLDKELLLLKATSTATIQCLGSCLHMLQQKQNAPPSAVIPPGATIEWLQPHPSRPSSQMMAASPIESYGSASSVPYIFTEPKPDGPINHSDEVEDKEGYMDTDLVGVEEHKSIILHLLSQLKLGMDLTKVVLPTFILEKRSLLELFADCMAHPENFLKITSEADAESRMLAVLEWYLTSFHAGRQGSVAKKPYNPIIGETFHCSWKLPDAAGSSVDSNRDGTSSPRQNLLTFTAEQVSHHPPISAFYFECPEKQMCMNASIWTKSKFMGMSVGVVMVGKITLKVLSHDEEYVFELPSAYARSILTVPWVEMGDKIFISCQKTGYSSAVTFHTKPFYGGRLHRVTAEVKNTNTGNVACRVQGEWNSSFELSYANGDIKVIDVNAMPVRRKRVRPIQMQGDFESRKLWQDVTASLALDDNITATEHKRFLEDRQREGERYRKETNMQYPTKYFHKEGEGWIYNHILKKGQTKAIL